MIEKALAERSLIEFTKQAFAIVEPGRQYVPNWHTDAIAGHLEHCVPEPVYDDNEQLINFKKALIDQLIINIPPRATKSLILCVMLPAWVWGPKNLPQMRFMFASYDQRLSTRDSVKCRRLIESEWYQNLWGDRFELVGDQNQKTRYETDKSGFRLATSVGAGATGDGGDMTIIDDPINATEAVRPAQTIINSTNEWHDLTWYSRCDPQYGSRVICMQRLAINDPCGYVVEKAPDGWNRLVIPMIYEGDNLSNTKLNFKDPRKKIGELLIPERINKKEIERLKERLGSYGTASQLQQNPVSKEGGMFQTENFQIANQLPSNREKQIVGAIRYWDKAGTEGGGAYTAGVLMVRYSDNTYYVLDVVRGQWEARQREPIIKQTAMNDKNLFPTGRYQVWTEQEPGSGGKESAQNTITSLSGLSVHADKVTGKKEVRAEPYSIQVENKNVYLVSGHWVPKFIQEHKDYLVGKYRDQVDAAGGAFNKLAFMKIARAI